MPVQIIRKEQLVGSERHLRTETYETVRFLLAADQAEVTVTDVTLIPDVEAEYGSEQHQEIAYCIEGNAELIDSATWQTHQIEPGVLWLARRGERFRFRAHTPTRLICVFTPPFVGHETGYAGDQ